MPRKHRPQHISTSHDSRTIDLTAVIASRVPVVWALALLVARWFVPAESAHLGETLWIVQLWLLTACAWSLSVLLWRSLPPRLDWADAAVWLLVAGHVLSALIVLSTEGQKRAALNMLWEWIGVGVAATLLRHWLRGAAGMQQFARTLATGAVVLGGLGSWQYCVEFPTYRTQLRELIGLEHRLEKPDTLLSAGERSRLRVLRQELGTVATEQDPVARFKLRQRLLDSTEPLGRFALTNSLAGLLAAGLILLLGAIAGDSRRSMAKWRLWLLSAAAGIVAFCLVLTKSRTAWAGLLIGLVGWGLLSFRRRIPVRRVLSASAIAVVTVGILVLVAAWSGGLDRLVLTETPKSLGYRIEYWTSTRRLISDHFLFGTGPGNFRQHYLQHKLPGSSEEILDPHNQFLDVWASGGVLALAGLAWIWLRFLQRCRRVDAGDTPTSTRPASHTESGGWRLAAVGSVALILVFLLQFVFEAIQDLPALALLAGWLIAAVILQEVEIPRAATLGAGLALGVHLLGAGGIAMPAISVPLMLLLLGTTGNGAAAHRELTEQSVAKYERQRLLFRLVLLLALLALSGASLLTGFWPSYYARLLIAAGEFAIFSGHDPAAARREFEAATRADQLDPDPWYDLTSLDYSDVNGNSAVADEAFDRAIGHLGEAIRRDPYSPKLYWTRGQWQLARFQSTGSPAVLEQALQSLEQARQGYPNHAGIRGTLAEALAAARRPAASEEARRALHLDDINRERGHIDLWLAPETRARLEGIAGQVPPTANTNREPSP